MSDDFIVESGMKEEIWQCKACGYAIPSHWDIGKVYKRLIKGVADREKTGVIDALFHVYNSFVSAKIDDYNSSMYYENPSTYWIIWKIEWLNKRCIALALGCVVLVEGCWYKWKGEYQHGRKIVRQHIERDVRVSVDCTDEKLQEVVLKTFSENEADKQEISNNDFCKFLDAKRIEGCSEKNNTVLSGHCGTFIFKMNQSVRRITTEEIRTYLSDYQKINRCSMWRLIISDEIYPVSFMARRGRLYLKSPMKRIHK